MTKAKPERPKWQAFLNKEERKEVDALQRVIKSASTERAKAVAKLGPIRNRAVKRASHGASA